MNAAVHGRRLASPVRLTLATNLGAPLDGGWWPHKASIAGELPELIDALSTRLGEIAAISINWSSVAGSPDLDLMNCMRMANPGGIIGHQRLMRVTGVEESANLLVVPCRTSPALAIMVLRQAATLPIMPIERSTQAFRTSENVVRAARAEKFLRNRRFHDAGSAQTGN
ncbi:DUF5994 family protein [Mycobacterium pseudokansasii]|uniref:DUF5994 family protein n=1 Tax=Mycobacterium pseudokansasii TaxID=2341080 RepID=UPI0004ACD574|nr:DUF5994 family protein [Mycobacterium pseudokansasii]VAZ89498.1 hypothetical protein LAUMK35_00945 [Mycobacterium pseudokansasii]VAZ90244.1 hypothetical protein LAUMK21_00944 [Mycobacterium pseudokansasii]